MCTVEAYLFWHVHCCPCSDHIRPSVGEVSWVYLLKLLGETTSKNSLFICLWQFFQVFLQWSLSLRGRSCFVDVFIGTGFQFDMLWFSVIMSICFKEKFPCWGVRITFICGYEDKYLECIYRLCWFSKVVVGSPLRSIISLGLGSWLDF